MRVIIDNNVLISIALKSTVLAPIRRAWVAKRFVLLGSTELFDELCDVLNRDKFKHAITAEEIVSFLDDLQARVTWIAPRELYPTFVDPKDEYLLAMVREGEANVLVTGDGALQALGRFETAEIISPRTFVDRLEGTARRS